MQLDYLSQEELSARKLSGSLQQISVGQKGIELKVIVI